MDKKEFTGGLENISPHLLIDKDKQDKFQNFFLILGMIFNDLKGLIFFQKLIEDTYRHPASEEVSVHAGEYNGLITQTNKLLIATVGEFLIFIEKNKDVTSGYDFLLLLKTVDQKTRANWSNLVDLNNEHNTSILSRIARIRSNIAFHYDHSKEELRKGFIRSFFSERKNLIQHQRAYFSIGDTMKFTRFYYVDAAVEEYIKSLITGEDMESIMKAISDMNLIIQALLKAYIKSIKVQHSR